MSFISDSFYILSRYLTFVKNLSNSKINKNTTYLLYKSTVKFIIPNSNRLTKINPRSMFRTWRGFSLISFIYIITGLCSISYYNCCSSSSPFISLVIRAIETTLFPSPVFIKVTPWVTRLKMLISLTCIRIILPSRFTSNISS